MEIAELQRLEQQADKLLLEISCSGQHVSDERLQELEAVAGAAARIAYGSGSPDLLTHQMSTLITWTDHLDEAEWVLRFKMVLLKRPLVHPWK